MPSTEARSPRPEPAPASGDPAVPGPLRRRPVLIGLCAALVTVLLAAAALLPLPFSVALPGETVDVQGSSGGEQVIRISGAEVREPEGELRMTTIQATGPDATVRLPDVVSGWFSSERAVMPRDAVYPSGRTPREIREYNTAQMHESQDAAVEAALGLLDRSGRGIEVELSLEDVGGPSAGLLFALGIVNLLEGDGAGGDLTGGRVIAGTGTIEADGTVGSVGGVPLKTQAARRDGATVFLVPQDECGEAEGDLPEGLRLVPVRTLADAVGSLRALAAGDPVPSC
ncbi:S16 family serine protease [Streptomyces sp. YIM 98790]|uniref:S16 family serine protease n=1 Tax=Streptomyces sp. YIM 98790 TaxID=2689077 RepID=UPI00140A9E3D|nr:S16 family serine protease [Streptomyces sp. YIM 98790]